MPDDTQPQDEPWEHAAEFAGDDEADDATWRGAAHPALQPWELYPKEPKGDEDEQC